MQPAPPSLPTTTTILWQVLETLSNMFIHVFDGLNTQFKSELEIISQVGVAGWGDMRGGVGVGAWERGREGTRTRVCVCG